MPRHRGTSGVTLPPALVEFVRQHREAPTLSVFIAGGMADPADRAHWRVTLRRHLSQRKRAIAKRPDVLLFDEPTGALDSDTTQQILALLADLHASGLTIVVVTHEAEVAEGVTVHLACHARAQNMGPKAAELIRLIPDTPVDVIERCAGHGGTDGGIDGDGA